jgi:hypothetical protein
VSVAEYYFIYGAGTLGIGGTGGFWNPLINIFLVSSIIFLISATSFFKSFISLLLSTVLVVIGTSICASS